ncbi:SPOC like C-terminal domain-containing protein [Mycena galopus ATCC 62051]|nr:SPOC like C-terminal domain-containing protein [Mycena galopus ATCC 62051]
MKEGYEDVLEYIPIGQPNAGTLAKLDALKPSNNPGDPLDALIVAIETQNAYLEKKKTWTRKIVIVTDGENPIEGNDLDATIERIKDLDIGLTVVGIDFDDEEFPYTEEDKSHFKAENEEFYKSMVDSLEDKGILGTCALALRETVRPDIKITKSTLMGTTLRLGDNATRPEEAMEINIKTSKCNAQSRPKSWKKFAEQRRRRGEGGKVGAGDDDDNDDNEDMDVDKEQPTQGAKRKVTFTQLKMRTEYYVDRRDHNSDNEGEDVKMEEPAKEKEPEPEDDDDDDDEEGGATNKIDPGLEQVDKEELIRGFKYGTTYVPCPDGQFERLPTKKGIEICGFFLAKNFRRELCLGEIQYVWGDPSQPEQQVAISSIAQAMYEKNAMAIARWVSKDGMDAKMGMLAPCIAKGYTFASLDNLVSKKGEVLKEHAYLSTETQLEAMDNFVDAMDAGEKDEEGNRGPWFDTRLSYNPAVHRIKQAQFHAAVVSDLSKNPLPPPHPELLKYFEPPRRVLKRARNAIEEVKSEFKVKQVPKKVTCARKDGHVHACDEGDDEMLVLDAKPPTRTHSQSQSQSQIKVTASPAGKKGKAKAVDPDDSVTEDDSDAEDVLAPLATKKPAVGTPPPVRKGRNPLPTPARSLSPEFDPARVPGRIVGNTRPLDDFKANIVRGDMVSKAVEDLGAVVMQIVMRPFANRRSAELMECMETLRDTCLKEDEIEAWNTFMTELRDKCTSKLGNSQFWSQVQDAGRKISLISDEEAEEHGGTSLFSESEAEKFLA